MDAGLRFSSFCRSALEVPATARRGARLALAAWGAWSARLSISLRLGVAFAAVAVLAIAANVIAEHGQQIILAPSSPAPVPRPFSVAVPPQPVPVAPGSLPQAAPIETPIRENFVIEALQQFERSVVRRAGAAEPDGTDTIPGAAERLHTESDIFLRRTAPASKGLRQGLERVLQDGGRLIQAADARRALCASYWAHFEKLDAQMKAALDNNWKIFGRVIERQSSVTLRHALDDVRRRSSELTASNREPPAVSEALMAAQRQFAGALEQNAGHLERAQGSRWLADMRQVLVAAQGDVGQIAALDSADVPTLAAFQAEVEEYTTAVHGAVEAHARGVRSQMRDQRANQQPPRAASPVVGVVAVPAAPIPGPTAQAAPPLAIPATVGVPRTAAGAPGPARSQLIIASISAAVLMLVWLISMATVRSIVTPIRDFMSVTARLAAGDLQARFNRGGTQELDALAIAFNHMAEKLAAAHEVTREHQVHLELRVDERTRQLQHLAEHDPLTGLPNRRQLLTHLESSLHRAQAEASQVAVFFLDLDNFKNINDSMGHAFGDLVLRQVADRLVERVGQRGFAARLGGDEFTVVCSGRGGTAELTQVGHDLVQAFLRPLMVEGRELLVSVSVGVSLYPEHERSPDALLRAADAALFNAKGLGRSRMSVFSRELLENAAVKFRIEQGLRRAVDRGELELLFQPEVSLSTLGVNLVEALLRWRLPDGRHVSPTEFLAVAEESGLIATINDWVLRSAIEAAAGWHYGAWPAARVAVNVTARQLLDSRFVERLSELLREHRLPPRCIEIELTETVLQTGPNTIETLRQLRELDISVALDDFGTGYSSLASLERLPLTRVKLDRSLIASLDSSSRSLAIARAIIGLCGNLRLEVTAEGVERSEQLALLLDHPELSLQGYLIAQPLPSETVPESLTRLPQHLQSLLLEARVEPAVAHEPAGLSLVQGGER